MPTGAMNPDEANKIEITVDTTKYKHYGAVVTALLGGQPFTTNIDMYLDEFEANRVNDIFERAVRTMMKEGSSRFSIIIRSGQDKKVTYAFTNVVQICHNVPQFEGEEEEEK